VIAASPLELPPAHVPDAPSVMALLEGENFPVASYVLPRRTRAHLLALYGFARLVDELGDEAPGDRLASLEWLAGELDLAYAGRAAHPLMRRLQPMLTECHLPREPFLRLIEANRVDQHVKRYETWEQLLGYCALSANPVGELVLGVFDRATPTNVTLSDSICTALQLTEHWQDVAEDFGRGRVYLPAEDLQRFGCSEDELTHSHAGPALRATLSFEVARTRELFDRGAPLLDRLRGRPRVAVAAFLGGGRAALGAIERADYDVLHAPPRAGQRRRLLALFTTLAQRGLVPGRAQRTRL
jgi:squalene synthase HpnC